MPSIRERIRNWLIPNEPSSPATTAAITAHVDDSPGWDSHQAGPADRPWAERADDLDDALEAWRKNFLVRRIVTLIRSYAVGGGITVSSRLPEVDRFAHAFWNHPQNRLPRRLGPICDELTRAGEIFPVLHTNRLDGMSYVRLVPASQIREIETADNDYESELRYGERQRTTADLHWWISPTHPNAYRPSTRAKRLEPLMLHWTVNKPIGATRGESDLIPILPWALRYSEWLKDRVRLNRQRTRQGVFDVEIADDSIVEQKRQQLRTSDPVEAGIYVHGQGEKTQMHNLEIGADDASEDGKVLRLATVTGANIALHYAGEGESTNYATAKEMGEPTARFFTERQNELCAMAIELVEVAYRRSAALGYVVMPDDNDLQLITHTTQVARADNASLAAAANQVAQALTLARQNGWIDAHTALALLLKFAGETSDNLSIDEILAQARREQPEPEPEPEPETER